VSYSNQDITRHLTGQTKSTTTELAPSVKEMIPAFDNTDALSQNDMRPLMNQAVRSWLHKTPSKHTRVNYRRDLSQFLDFIGLRPDQFDHLATVRPEHVAAWRDDMRGRGFTNATIRRKMTALRALFSYLQIYGYVGANPAHGKFVAAPAASRDGKTVGLSPADCRRLLEAPDPATPMGIRDRAMLAVLAYSACRVGELVVLSVGDFKTSGQHRILSIYGKGGKERLVPLHVEAIERLNLWIELSRIEQDRDGPLFRPVATPRGHGFDGFFRRSLTTRSIEKLVSKYVTQLGLDPAVTVHSLRVTALTTAREQGADIVALQHFAGHADPRTTLSYIRSRDRLSKSPAYMLSY
jgi:integrase/recombinase XerD